MVTIRVPPSRNATRPMQDWDAIRKNLGPNPLHEPALVGWEEIAAMFRVSVRTAKSWRQELTALRILFKLRRGRPPRTFTCAWPSDMRLWATFKAMKGEVI
jgi:hypothetical protein